MKKEPNLTSNSIQNKDACRLVIALFTSSPRESAYNHIMHDVLFGMVTRVTSINDDMLRHHYYIIVMSILYLESNMVARVTFVNDVASPLL